MCCVGANQWASGDRAMWQWRGPVTVPFWNLFLLRAQLFIVYFYAGIAKLNGDWLRGEPVRTWLARRSEMPFFGPYLTEEWVVWAVTYGGLFFDLFIGFLLLWRPTRALALAAAFFFHLINDHLFSIGIFPEFAFAMTLLFLEPDWPRRVLAWPRALRERLGGKREPSAVELQPNPVEDSPEQAVDPLRQRLVLGFMALYLGWQLLFPLRHWLYPGDVNWTEEGHRFSWRMKLRDKEGTLRAVVRDPGTGKEWTVPLQEHLARHQRTDAATRPDMTLQLAHYLRDYYRREKDVAAPQVYVSARCRLNDHPEAELIDPRVDLAAQRRSLWPASWILPQGLPPKVEQKRALPPPALAEVGRD